MINKLTNIVRYVILIGGSIFILSILLSGCDNLKCYPEFDINGIYIGIKCGGQF